MQTRKAHAQLPKALALVFGFTALSLPSMGQGGAGSTKLLATDSVANDSFGEGLDVDGDTVLVGAPFAEGPLSASGAAYLFDGQTGLELLRLLPADPVSQGNFGASVALQGSVAVVGSPFASTPLGKQGAAYVFDSATGAQLLKIEVANSAFQPFLGRSVALDGNRLLVGAPRANNSAGVQSGAAYLFELPSGVLLHSFEAPDGADSDWFGHAVAIDGDRIAVGAHQDDDFGSGSGSVHTFDATTGSWLAKFAPSDLTVGDSFGLELDLEGDNLLVGARSADPLGTVSGAAYLFHVDSGALQFKWSPTDGAPGDHFGSDVALRGNTAAIGARLDDTPGFGTLIGAVYLFDTQTGLELAKIVPGDLSNSDTFGNQVSLSDTLVVGSSPGDDDKGSNSGAVYAIDAGVRLEATSFCFGVTCPCGNDDPAAGCVNSRGFGAELLAAGTSRVSADDLVLQARRLPLNSFALYFMGPNSQAASPLGDGLLCVSGGLLRYTPAGSTGPGGRLFLGPGAADLSGTLFGAGGTISAGSTWNFQVWARDTAGPCGSGSNTTNAVAVTFVP